MRAHGPIPNGFDSGAWSVQEALELGVGAGRLRGADLGRPFRGVRSIDSELPRPLAYHPLLRAGDRFSAVTAARLLGAPLPAWTDRLVHVTAGPGLTRPRTAGVVGHADDGRTPSWLRDVPISSPELAFLESAGLLPLDDLVAIGDFLVHSPRIAEPGRPWTTIAALRAATEAPRRRWIRRAREAVGMVRDGVESRRETRLRMLLVASGVPEPRCGRPVHDAHGDRIGWFDLVWDDYRVIAEYDGDQHRTSTAQYEKDMRRFELATEAGWRIVRVRSWGLRDGAIDTVVRVRRALAAGGWRA